MRRVNALHRARQSRAGPVLEFLARPGGDCDPALCVRFRNGRAFSDQGYFQSSYLLIGKTCAWAGETRQNDLVNSGLNTAMGSRHARDGIICAGICPMCP